MPAVRQPGESDRGAKKAREATEVAAAEDIRRFYGSRLAPLPEGVTPATEEELAGADAEQW